MAGEHHRKTILDGGWLAARSTEVQFTGTQLTTTHPPTSPNPPWIEAVVPGTVLATLVKNKIVPDPFYGLQNETIIDIADSGRDFYTFWFFTTFHCNLSTTNQYCDLNFRGINYSADVYLNGHKTVLPKGMFRRHSIDVTDILHPNGNNLLAVLVHPPDHPGTIPPEGGQGGDHEIGKDVTTQYVEGWDWMTPIRDRNTGIWDEVSISVTGPVKIIDPHLVSSFFDNYERAYLHTTTELENRSSWSAECSLTVQVTLELEDNICLVEHLQTQNLSIPAESRVQYTFPELFFYKPDLWWPNGMGKQTLYSVVISIDVKGFGESDSWSHLFGFRKIESHIDNATGGRLFKVNGEPVFIRGANWILSDGLLRLSKKRYNTDIKFHADMNLNMIRCWGGGLTERPEFYHYCDYYGLLGDVNSVQLLLQTVQKFSDSTGLIANPNKCKVFCGGMDNQGKEQMLGVTRFTEGHLPMRYLGIPITCKRLNINHYMPLIDKVMARINHWTSKLLSYSGRVLLVRSVILAITQYWMQCLPLPQFVIKKINSMCRMFVWNGNVTASRKSPVAWKTLC